MQDQIKSYIKGIVRGLEPKIQLKLFGLAQVPLLFLANPTVLKMDEESCEMRLPYNRLTKNHLSSVYFGAQAIGADACVGILAIHLGQTFPGYEVVPIFKSFKAQFLKRAEGDMVYVCRDGAKIKQMIGEAIEGDKRVTEMISVEATVPEFSTDLVSKFELELSLRVRPIGEVN
jgi:hypothetical protein